ncbi:MAG: hypothetical protein ACRDYU_15320 [Actinomycetes bacterium]
MTVTGPLGALAAVHPSKVAVTTYLYVPTATPESWQVVAVVGDEGVVPQAGEVALSLVRIRVT